jgi:CRISPR-associated protein Csc1
LGDPQDHNLHGVRVLRLTLRLDDYLWFASYEWGKEIETAPVLHSYALSFALSGREKVIATGGVPDYEADLAEIDVYCTPARLILDRSPSPRRRAVLTYNSVENPTLLTESKRLAGGKSNDPKFGRRQVLVPGLRFDLVAFVRRDCPLPRVFRLGKKRSPVVIEDAQEITGRANSVEEPRVPSHAINPLDVTGQVLSCVPRVLPPHMVYETAEIRDDVFISTPTGPVHVPERVRRWISV